MSAVVCPKCGKRWDAEDDTHGKAPRCPRCAAASARPTKGKSSGLGRRAVLPCILALLVLAAASASYFVFRGMGGATRSTGQAGQTDMAQATAKGGADGPDPPAAPPPALSPSLADELARADDGVKLAPVAVSMAGVEFTIQAPEGAKVSKESRALAVTKGDNFHLLIRPGCADLAAAADYWRRGGDLVPSVPPPPGDTPVLIARHTPAGGGPAQAAYRFLTCAALAHLDVSFTNPEFSGAGSPHSRADCLLMAKCARSATLVRVTNPLRALADFQQLGVRLRPVEGGDGKRFCVTFGEEPFTDAMLGKLVAAAGQAAGDVTDLDLGDTAVSDQGLAHLRGLPSLRVLYLPAHRQEMGLTGARFDVLAGLAKLEELYADDALVNDAGLARLGGAVRLKVLELSGTRVTGETAAPIFVGMTDLESLSLGNAPFTDDGLRRLTSLTALRYLDLPGTRVTDAGLPHLAGLTKLTSLSLAGTKVNGAGFASLGRLTALEHLRLARTEFNDSGLRSLAAMTGLQTLDLAETPATGDGFASLKGLTRLRGLVLAQSQLNDTGLGQVTMLTSLQDLDIGDTKITDAGLKQLRGLVELETLSLPNTPVNGRGLEGLESMARLTTLTLARTKVTDDALASLKGCKALRELDLNDMPITGTGLVHLGGLRGLQTLQLNGTRLNDAGLANARGLSNLAGLGIGNTQVTDAGLESLEGLKELKSVSAFKTKVTKVGADKLKQALPDVNVYLGE